MSRLPLVSAKRLESILLTLGFEKVRQKGSHALYRHPDGRITTIPHHTGHDLARPLIRSILHDIKLSPERYRSLLNR